jgi:UPF0176 protein
MKSSTSYINIAAYKFVTLDDTVDKRPQYLALCNQLGLKGTILLSPEGINLFLAGWRESIDQFLKRMLVKLKREIITMNHPLIQPEKGRAPAVDAITLKRWLDQGHDDTGKPIVMVDTRNAFEVDVGSFDRTVDYRIGKFSEFPDVIARHKDELDGKTVVTFCTGGIRCEKAAIHMKNVGFDSVYQLDGGILKYFEQVGGDHYTGDCFVFDHRTALNPRLEPTTAAQCAVCHKTVTPREQISPLYQAGICCPHCAVASADPVPDTSVSVAI